MTGKNLTTTVTAQKEQEKVHVQKITERPFIAPQHKIGDPLDPFAVTLFKQQLKDRLAKKTFPDQGDTSLCGPAAFFYFLQTQMPHFYRGAAEQLYATGDAQIGNLKIVPSNACKHPTKFFDGNKPRISGLDWITLGSLRNSSNWLASYNNPDQKTSAISTPWDIERWMLTADRAKIYSASHGSSPLEIISKKQFIEANNHFKQGCSVFALISGALLDGQPATIPAPTHWVVWSSTLNDKNGNPIASNLKSDDIVKQTAFSWDKNRYPIKANFNFFQFSTHVFHIMVFKKRR